MTVCSVVCLKSASIKFPCKWCFSPMGLLTNTQSSRRPNHDDQVESGTARKRGKNARVKRFITGSEVILTPESVDALQKVATASPYHNLTPYFSGRAIGPFADLNGTSGSNALLRAGLSSGNPWFLGGIEPFNSLPHTDGEPFCQRTLIRHCKSTFSQCY
jgi:uncharacterized protein YciI